MNRTRTTLLLSLFAAAAMAGAAFFDIPADGYSLTNHMIQLFLRGQEP